MNRTDDLPALAPGEAAAIRNRLARMTPRNMARDTPLDQLRSMHLMGLELEVKRGTAAGTDTALITAEIECQHALRNIIGRALPRPE